MDPHPENIKEDKLIEINEGNDYEFPCKDSYINPAPVDLMVPTYVTLVCIKEDDNLIWKYADRQSCIKGYY